MASPAMATDPALVVSNATPSVVAGDTVQVTISSTETPLPDATSVTAVSGTTDDATVDASIDASGGNAVFTIAGVQAGTSLITFSATGYTDVTATVTVTDPAAPAPSTPVDDGAWKQNLQPSPASVPGFFSGQKWTITRDAAGVSTIRINLAKSQAGKTAKIYKRTIKGNLILLGEMRLGKNGRTVLETDKPLRPGQKVRVQVDGKFRSTVTIP